MTVPVNQNPNQPPTGAAPAAQTRHSGPKALPDTSADQEAAAANGFMIRLSVLTAAIHGLTASPTAADSLMHAEEPIRTQAQRRVAEAAWGIANHVERMFSNGR